MKFGVKVKGHGSNKLVSMGARQGWEKNRTLLIFLVSRCKFRFWRCFFIWPFAVKVKGHGSNKLVSIGARQGWEKIRTLLIFLSSRCKFRFWRRFFIWPLGSRSKVMGQISWYPWAPGRGEKKFELYWFSWSPGVSFDFGAVFSYDLWGQGQRSWVK